MLKPNHNQADLLMTVARRHGGQHPVNRHYMPPLHVFAKLIKRGSLTVKREGLSKSRTTYVELTAAGRAEAIGLAPSYQIEASVLEALKA